MEFLLFGGALGVVAALIVPLLYGRASSFLPATITTNANVPTTIPSGGAAIVWSVVTCNPAGAEAKARTCSSSRKTASGETAGSLVNNR